MRGDSDDSDIVEEVFSDDGSLSSSNDSGTEGEEDSSSLDIDDLNDEIQSMMQFDATYEARQRRDFCDMMETRHQQEQELDIDIDDETYVIPVTDPPSPQQQQRDEVLDNPHIIDTTHDHLTALERDVTPEQLHALWTSLQQHDTEANSSPSLARNSKDVALKAPQHAQRCNDSTQFCTELMSDMRLTKYERDHLRCEPEYFREARRRFLDQGNTNNTNTNTNDTDIERALATDDDRMQVEEFQQQQQKHPVEDPYKLQTYTPQPLTAEEKKKKIFTMRLHGAHMLFIIENYVHVTYFVNALTGDLCKFSLRDLAHKLLDYYVEYSCKKFAKVNLRLHDGLSFLLYTSSVLVETGSDNQLLSRRLLQYVIAVLREKCGYPHINIKRRKCQNIVATGKLSYHVCMHVLKHKFTAAREKDGFAGLVIKHRDLDKFFQNHDKGDTGFECVPTDAYVDDDDDDEVIALINSVNDRKLVQQQQQAAEKQRQALSGGGSGGSTTITPGFIINEYGEEEDEEKAFQRISKLIDEHDPRSSAQLNGTAILFKEGQFISTGCKTDKELVQMMPLLMRLTYKCRECKPKNRRQEAMLVAQKKHAPHNNATQQYDEEGDTTDNEKK